MIRSCISPFVPFVIRPGMICMLLNYIGLVYIISK